MPAAWTGQLETLAGTAEGKLNITDTAPEMRYEEKGRSRREIGPEVVLIRKKNKRKSSGQEG